MKLVIAEKPSVAKEIATILKANERKDGFFIGNGYIVSWCIGHLVQPSNPHEYDESYKKWNKEDLPIIPEQFKYNISKNTKDQYEILKELMHRSEITKVVNACDAGREGELIFRLVYNNVNCKKPIKRLWINSLETNSIKQGFENLKDGTNYESLYKAAIARQKSDWIVGINATRLFSILYDTDLNVGRVMSPTLAMIVDRQKTIDNFVSELFYQVEAVVENFSFIETSGKQKDKSISEEILFKARKQPLIVKNLQNNNKFTSPPKLFDLTTLQREANKLYGYTASKTLEIAQNLYEKKLITYPRTDSKFLSSDMKDNLELTIEKICKLLNVSSENLNIIQVIDNTKVTDHHAIIPTGILLDNLSNDEKVIINLINIRFITAISPKYEYSETVVELLAGESIFIGKAKMILQNGFRNIENLLRSNVTAATVKEELTKFKIGQVIENATFFIKEGQTNPPKPYTEDTLLGAMEHAGKEDFDKDVERVGLGTPATRASTIEKLISTGMITRVEKNIKPTIKGTLLIQAMPQTLKSPTLTSKWENELKEIELGKKSYDSFIADIKLFITDIVVNNAKPNKELYDHFPRDKKNNNTSLGQCPRCQNSVSENKVAFSCVNKDCKFAIFKNNKYFSSIGFILTKVAVTSFLTNGSYVTSLYSINKKKNYKATLVMEDNPTGYTKFEMKFK